MTLKLCMCCYWQLSDDLNPLNAELNPICHLLEFLGAHHILYISRIRVNTANLKYFYYDILSGLYNTGCQTVIILEGCLTVHLPDEIIWNANLMQQGNSIYLDINQLDALNFIMSLFHASACFNNRTNIILQIKQLINNLYNLMSR